MEPTTRFQTTPILAPPSLARVRPPRWYAIPLRVLLLTFIGTLLIFAVSLFVAIIGTVVAAQMHGTQPDMRIAYRHFALPAAQIAAGMIFLAAWVMEIRHYRQSRALASIARVS